MRFHFHAHTDLAQLAKEFIDDRRQHPEWYRSATGGIFAPETLLVPSAGISQWLKLQRMDHGEVLLGATTKDLEQGIREILHGLCPDFPPERYTADVMKWAIFSLLGTLPGEGERQEEKWKALREYLQRDDKTEEAKELRRHSFAEKIARLFDQYQSYLPHTLSAWAKGKSLDRALEKEEKELAQKQLWQPLLWHKLHEHLGGCSLAEALDHVLYGSENKKESLPPITVFGATMMPPAYLQLLKKYSQWGEVNFYYHGPCREFWGDNRLSKKVEDGFYQNNLLADNARQAQDFFNLLVEEGLLSGGEEESAGKPDTLLQAVQEQVRTNTPRPENPTFTDDSLTFHLCHSPRRQVEVLRDLLLYLLRSHNAQKGGADILALNDILVMAPDITQFAPAIKAVFDASPLKGRYAVADRTLRQTNLLAESFLKILQLPDNGFPFSQIDALLDSQPLCQRFGFSPEQLPDIRQWLRESRVHLGYDGKSRKEDFESRGIQGVTEEQDEFTWRKALDRMLLAEVMELPANEENQRPAFACLLPLPVSTKEGNDHQTLGNLSRLLTELHETSEKLNKPQERTATEWRCLLQEILERFFLEDSQNTADFSALRKQFQQLEENVKSAKADDLPISRSLMTDILQRILEAATTSSGSPSFLAGKITCCSLRPMRGIPCKIIALLGMDQGAFPRQDPHQDFSLLNDTKLLPHYVRSRATEDRYIFLETLLAAREKLILFYQAFQEDGKEQPPAMVVKQLQDYVKQLHPDSLDVRHRLNGFDVKNFQENPTSLLSLFSFDKHSARAGTPYQSPQSPQSPQSLSSPSSLPATLEITLWDLEKFLEDGVEAFLQHALGCRPKEEEADTPEDQEPLKSNGLEKSQCLKRLDRRLRPLQDTERQIDQVWAELKNDLRARDLLPFGLLGEKTFQDYKEKAKNALEKLGEAEEKERELSLEIPGDGGGPCSVSLRGTCLVAKEESKEKLLHVFYGEDFSNKHRIVACLERLLWEATQEEKSLEIKGFSFADGNEKSVKIEPASGDAQTILEKLVGSYCRTWREPQPVTLELLRKVKSKNEEEKNTLSLQDFEKLEPERYFPGWNEEKLKNALRDIASFLPDGFPLCKENDSNWKK